MKKYVLVGGGGFCREMINWIRQLEGPAQGDVVGVVDDNPDCLARYNYGVPHIGTTAEYVPTDEVEVVLSVGRPKSRVVLSGMLLARNPQTRFATIIHPSAVIAASAQLGKGLIVCPHALISADAKVGDFVTVNACSSIGHDATVGDFCTLSAHVDLMGFSTLGSQSFAGSGARVMPSVVVGNECTLGAGSTAMRRLPDGMTLYAPPSKKM
ncbi:NeuD/PglB/VioB family sugar acetyltransferase [Pandoraea apista]|uniref:Acetyltransferase n=1 Tax=Pandoraea apista TaxID=93218 RepID=A0ABX9ZNV5_9BURK|nr:NeuD/PglB/VioB family sugar acetyltransferase [Pandoraea apista]PTD99364.1 acetyltransferase [Pandoraea apista]RRJ31609.1 acetyltransferase [Pandoraea apista]RRJ81312.1 acetyltransferase [Pandoraea apista]RRW96610.1 acetyltransferase [Pandoraea apista]RRX03672.1 acetyltransferase [Pandoraea apista]